MFALILDGLALAKELALALGMSTLGAEIRTIVAMASGHSLLTQVSPQYLPHGVAVRNKRTHRRSG